MTRSRSNTDAAQEGAPKIRATAALTVTRVTRSLVRTTRATVLFADLRGYTGLAERLPPAHIVPLLDEFFGMLAAVTSSHQGKVFHMAGDGMMAGFGVDGTLLDAGACSALTAGHRMLEAFSELATRWREEFGVDVGIGIGLHQGDVAVGSLGPPGRKHTTLVGDTVNVAARLCGRARAGEVLLSCTVASAIEGQTRIAPLDSRLIPFLQLPRFELKGRTEPLDIWCVPAVARVSL
jgi:adenylate cyclase